MNKAFFQHMHDQMNPSEQVVNELHKRLSQTNRVRNRRKVWLYCTVGAGCLMLVVALFSWQWYKAKKMPLPISNLHASYSINVQDQKALMGDADFCFAAHVDKLVRTDYLHPVDISDANGTRTVRLPYTQYEVSVLEPIKGQLTRDQKVSLSKAGGISENKLEYYLYERDFLPALGGTYVFFAYVQPDGSLLVSGENSTQIFLIPGQETDTGAVVGNMNQGLTQDQLITALADQITTERQRFDPKFN